MSNKSKQWLDNLKKDHGVVCGIEVGIEIVCREVVEKCREYGAAEITQQVRLSQEDSMSDKAYKDIAIREMMAFLTGLFLGTIYTALFLLLLPSQRCVNSEEI